jgi:ribulose-5-phosphate 4-epimerase/fuculose-1-phosphate aldolase
VFATVAEERLHRKRMLAAAFRLFSRFGFDEGVAGHITARDPEQLDHFWVNPFGMHFSQIRASDLILVNHRGEVVEGNYPVNGAAFAIHSQVHAARPDVIAAAHAHSMYGKSWASLGRPLDPITQDSCAFYAEETRNLGAGSGKGQEPTLPPRAPRESPARRTTNANTNRIFRR